MRKKSVSKFLDSQTNISKYFSSVLKSFETSSNYEEVLDKRKKTGITLYHLHNNSKVYYYYYYYV